MSIRTLVVSSTVIALVGLGATNARAQAQSTDESPWTAEVGVGIDPSINGVVNSGAIGELQGLATAILPNSYGSVYGTGVQLRFGAGYRLDDMSELRGVFIYQSADADLVRLGDIGPSSLYAQYSDYKALSLDAGYRRYMSPRNRDWRVYAEGTLGIAFVDNINVLLAAPQANLIFNQTDFYDSTAAFTWTISGGLLFRVARQVDINAQIGLRHVGGLSDVDQFQGTGLSNINNDTARLTFPVVVGVRFRFR
jgi:hypothetical protein